MGTDEEALAHKPRASELLARAARKGHDGMRSPPGTPAPTPSGMSPHPATSRPVFSTRTARPAHSNSARPARQVNANRRAQDPPWASDKLPAGSGYSEEEWAAAREGGKYHVIELLSDKERGLIAITTRNPAPGKASAWGITAGRAFDGCMLVGPGGNPSHPNHVRENAVVVTDKDGKRPPFCYGIIEPAEMLNEWGRGASIALEGRGLLDDPATGSPEVCEQDDTGSAQYERQR